MDCRSCTRRALLQGAGAAVAAGLIGCGNDVNPTGGDAGPLVDAAIHFTDCGTNMICLDLNQPVNQSLNNVGGAIIFEAPNGDTIVVIRASATVVDTVSDICTHMGCNLRWNGTLDLLVCPCHGSEFLASGSVVKGPATRPLRSYATTFDSAMNLVTITMA